MNYYPQSLQILIQSFSKLPGIGKKTAFRLAMHMIESDVQESMQFANAIVQAKKRLKFCEECFNLCEDKECNICKDKRRNSKVICVVESIKDLYAVEKTQDFRGVYHVLHGAISPMDGIGPSDLRIRELLKRIEKDEIDEIILATNPTVEGEATAVYLSKLIQPMNILITRLAHGVPVGSDLEYADEVTLSRALEGRRQL
jgi:recombination protein RecR